MRYRRRSQPERPMLRAVESRHPKFVAAVIADLTVASEQRGEKVRRTNRLALVGQAVRMAWITDAFGALVAYRLQAACQRRGTPCIPRLAHRWSMRSAQVSIGDRAHVEPGIFLPHGQVTIDGFVEVQSGVHIRPYVTIGLKEGTITGATIGRNVRIGTGAKLLGPVTIGDGAVVGANAVVLHDVAANTTVVGAPARPTTERHGSVTPATDAG